MLSIYETKLASEPLDSRYTGAEGFAFAAQAAEIGRTYSNTEFLRACARAYANKDWWISQRTKSRTLTQKDTHLWTP